MRYCSKTTHPAPRQKKSTIHLNSVSASWDAPGARCTSRYSSTSPESLLVNMLITAATSVLQSRSFFLTKYSRTRQASSLSRPPDYSLHVSHPVSSLPFWWGREGKGFVHTWPMVTADFIICVVTGKPRFFSFSGCIANSFSLKSSSLNWCGNKCQCIRRCVIFVVWAVAKFILQPLSLARGRSMFFWSINTSLKWVEVRDTWFYTQNCKELISDTLTRYR